MQTSGYTPIGKSKMCLALLKQTLYLFEGDSGSISVFVIQVSDASLEVERIDTLSSPNGRKNFEIAEIENSIYLFGGMATNVIDDNNIYMFNAANAEWTIIEKKKCFLAL